MFEERRAGGFLVLAVQRRRLDASVAADFKAAAVARLESGERQVVVDLAQVEFIDSSGLGALVGLLKRMGGEGRLELSGLTRPVQKVFSLTRMNTVFTIRDAAPA